MDPEIETRVCSALTCTRIHNIDSCLNFDSNPFVLMSESLGLEVVNRVEDTDRMPFVKALAHIATADNSVDLDEKEMVQNYTNAWTLSENEKAQVQSILDADQKLSVNKLTAEFSESGTRFLLIQELMRLSHADGTYGNAERKEIAAIAQRMGMGEQRFREVEKWVGRGQAYEEHEFEEENGEGDALEDAIKDEDRDDEDDYDLSDIKTADSDLDEIDPGGYDIDEEELDEIMEEEEEPDDTEVEEEDGSDSEGEASAEGEDMANSAGS